MFGASEGDVGRSFHQKLGWICKLYLQLSYRAHSECFFGCMIYFRGVPTTRPLINLTRLSWDSSGRWRLCDGRLSVSNRCALLWHRRGAKYKVFTDLQGNLICQQSDYRQRKGSWHTLYNRRIKQTPMLEKPNKVIAIIICNAWYVMKKLLTLKKYARLIQRRWVGQDELWPVYYVHNNANQRQLIHFSYVLLLRRKIA